MTTLRFLIARVRIEGRLDARLLGAALDRAADVEGAHGELGARLADRLRRDDADRLADVDGGAAGKIAPVARAAQTPFSVSQVSTERILTSVDAGPLDRLDLVLVDQLAGLDDACVPVERIDRRPPAARAAEDALGRAAR